VTLLILGMVYGIWYSYSVLFVACLRVFQRANVGRRILPRQEEDGPVPFRETLGRKDVTPSQYSLAEHRYVCYGYNQSA
jgi:hypothetical protein